MSDAPRWPGADGSPGLDFSRAPKGAGVAADADGARQQGGARDESGSAAPGGSPTTPPRAAAPASPAAPEGRTPGPAETNKIPSMPLRGTTSAQQTSGPPTSSGAAAATSASGSQRETVFRQPPPSRPKTQNADDWELDSITRSAPSAERRTSPSSSEPELVKASRAASNPKDDKTVTTTRPIRRTRKARLRLHRIDPASVMKTSFLFSIAFAVMFVSAVAVLWSVFAGSDTMVYINDFVNSIIADESGERRFDIGEFLGWERVVGFTAVLGAINVVIFTAVATLFAFLYNLSATIMGGLEVTLAED